MISGWRVFLAAVCLVFSTVLVFAQIDGKNNITLITSSDIVVTPGSEITITAQLPSKTGKSGTVPLKWTLNDDGAKWASLSYTEGDTSVSIIGRSEEVLAAKGFDSLPRPPFLLLRASFGELATQIYLPYRVTEKRNGAAKIPASIMLELVQASELSFDNSVEVQAVVTGEDDAPLPDQTVNWKVVDAADLVRIGYKERSVTDANGRIRVELFLSPTARGKPLPAQFNVKATANGRVLDIIPIRFKTGPVSGLIDAEYYVMSEKEARHTFGRSVADEFYAIGVSINNKTQTEFQLSSIFFEKDKKKLNTAPFGVVAAVQERRKLVNARSFLLAGIGALGNLMTGFTPFFFNVGHRDRFTTFTNIITVPGRNTVDSVFPNTVPNELRNLEHLGLHGNRTIENRSEPLNGVVFVSKAAVHFETTEESSPASKGGQKQKATKDPDRNDPVRIKEALGRILVSGVAIEKPAGSAPTLLNND